MADINKRTSPYRKTPIQDFYMSWWAPILISPRDTDTQVTISAEHHLRPDLLAYQIYGSPNLFWIFAIRNKDVLFDPINDFVSGTEIWVPSPATINTLVN